VQRRDRILAALYLIRQDGVAVLQEELGAKAMDQTIPTLLEALQQPGKGSGTALQALTEVMNVCFRFFFL
jgi:hypothetical protein